MRALKRIMAKERFTQLDLAKGLGKSPQTINAMVNRDNLSVDYFLNMLEVMNYKLVAMRKDVANQEGWIEIQ